MESPEREKEKRKHWKAVLTLVQSCLISILIILVVLMMTQISRLQGTARVINYAGLVRGATQRLVKLELSECPDREMVQYLDNILSGLKYEEGDYDLICLEDEEYQHKLDQLMLYWSELKTQIQQVRKTDGDKLERKALLEMSETYFLLADETVFAAEVYSEKIARRIRTLEVASVVDIFMLLCILVQLSVSAMWMRRKNAALAKKAYIDIHTGLQNKNRCEELLRDETPLREPTACLMFDINNLKQTNDTWGHSVGDELIANFAKQLKNSSCPDDFVGRCGGDEFMILLYHADAEAAQSALKKIRGAVARFNQAGDNLPISYAEGWAVSADYPDCTVRTLFDAADRSMYQKKKQMKTDAEE